MLTSTRTIQILSYILLCKTLFRLKLNEIQIRTQFLWARTLSSLVAKRSKTQGEKITKIRGRANLYIYSKYWEHAIYT